MVPGCVKLSSTLDEVRERVLAGQRFCVSRASGRVASVTPVAASALASSTRDPVPFVLARRRAHGSIEVVGELAADAMAGRCCLSSPRPAGALPSEGSGFSLRRWEPPGGAAVCA